MCTFVSVEDKKTISVYNMDTRSLLPKHDNAASECQDLPDNQSLYGSTGGGKHPEDAHPPSASKDRLSSRQRKVLFCLSLVTILNGSLTAVMMPFFPVEAASRGVSQTVISGVFSCFAVAKILFSSVVGRLAPAVGVTRLYNIGLALAGLSTVAFGTLNYIQDTDLFMGAIFALRIVEAAGSVAVSTCGFTIAGSQFEGRVTTAVAVIGSSQTLGIALTPVIWGGLYAAGGFGTPFYTLGVIMLIMAAVNSRFMPTIERSDCVPAPFFSTLMAFAGSVDNWLCLGTIFMFTADVTTVESSFAVYANEVLHVPPSLVGIFYLVAVSLFALVNILWARLSERLPSPFPMISLCLLTSSVGILLIAPSPLFPLRPHWLITGIGMTVEMVFFGGAFTPCFKAMLDSSIAHGLEDSMSTKAFVSGMFHSAHSLGVAVGPVSGGTVIDRYGFALMTTGIGFMTALLGGVVALKRCGCSRVSVCSA